MITGHCECGKVRFQINGVIHDFSHCHCSQCRRLHGSAFASFAEVKKNEFSYLSGEEELKSYASSESSQRVFCQHCGSNILVAVDDEPNELFVSMSAIEGNPPCPEGHHIFVGSKAPWHEINDQLPKYNTFKDEY